MINNFLSGNEVLGIEFGSTRIKAVLIDESYNTVASGSYTWENKFENGYWTYDLKDVVYGMQSAYADLNNNVFKIYGSNIKNISALGISAMMHGYLPFDDKGNQLAPFRTWRNTTTYEAATELTKLFNFNIPQRWSIAHLYQAILNNESHVEKINFITTLAGYVHYLLSGEKVVGVGEASGMFPIDSNTGNYDENMLKKFSSIDSVKKYKWNIESVLPRVLSAGESGGRLTENGAKLIDPSGNLQPGAVMCPPEGDAGTGMVATNSVAEKTGNVSAGTSIFSMVVLEKQLKNVYEEIDIVTTPNGKPVAMVHCNNCCTDLDYWVNLFYRFAQIGGFDIDKSNVYDILYQEALNGDKDCGGVLTYNYFSGEPVSHVEQGRPVVARSQNAKFNLANFMRSNIYSALATLKIGMEILDKENVKIDCLTGHGGLFKTKYVGQKLLAGAVNCPVTVMKTAGEGGAWGIAVLAAYSKNSKNSQLSDYLNNFVFSNCESVTENPNTDDVAGFEEYIEKYKNGLEVEKLAGELI